MNEHTKRLLRRINRSLKLYIEQKLTEKELLANVESHCGGIEEHNVESVFAHFTCMVDEAIHIYDQPKCRNICLEQINLIQIQLNLDELGESDWG